jgi:hypothetical protein
VAGGASHIDHTRREGAAAAADHRNHHEAGKELLLPEARPQGCMALVGPEVHSEQAEDQAAEGRASCNRHNPAEDVRVVAEDSPYIPEEVTAAGESHEEGSHSRRHSEFPEVAPAGSEG